MELEYRKQLKQLQLRIFQSDVNEMAIMMIPFCGLIGIIVLLLIIHILHVAFTLLWYMDTRSTHLYITPKDYMRLSPFLPKISVTFNFIVICTKHYTHDLA